jgi:hypothetical protein
MPGPAAYDTAQFDAIGGKLPDSRKPLPPRAVFGHADRFAPVPGADSPAPGQYGAFFEDPNKPRAPRPVFGKSRRGGAAAGDTPAPGQYSPQADAVLNKPAMAVFGSSKRFNDVGMGTARETPGPGYNQNVEAVMKAAPRVKFGSAPRDRDPAGRTATPGPQYDTESGMRATRPSSARAKLGHAPRFSAPAGGDLPGPADYGNATMPMKRAPAFTMRSR